MGFDSRGSPFTRILTLVAILLGASFFFVWQQGRWARWSTLHEKPSHESIRVPAQIIAPKNHSSLKLCSEFYNQVCSSKGPQRDPTGRVLPDTQGELLALRTLEGLVRTHPEWTVEQLDDAYVEQVYTPARRGKAARTFEWVQARLKRLLRNQGEDTLSKKDLKTLLERVQKTRLVLPPPSSVYDAERALLTQTTVSYEPDSFGPGGTLRIGGAFFLSVQSKFNMIFTMAHELGHSIDPCLLRSIDFQLPPGYQRLLKCFDKEKYFPPLKQSSGKKTSVNACSGIQDETFADWIASQITIKALTEFASEFEPSQVLAASMNAVRDLCEEASEIEEVEKGTHPDPRVRIEQLFGNHPEMRNFLGCEAQDDSNRLSRDSYCSMAMSPPPMNQSDNKL